MVDSVDTISSSAANIPCHPLLLSLRSAARATMSIGGSSSSKPGKGEIQRVGTASAAALIPIDSWRERGFVTLVPAWAFATSSRCRGTTPWTSRPSARRFSESRASLSRSLIPLDSLVTMPVLRVPHVARSGRTSFIREEGKEQITRRKIALTFTFFANFWPFCSSSGLPGFQDDILLNGPAH
jgi:hypothetical protein